MSAGPPTRWSGLRKFAELGLAEDRARARRIARSEARHDLGFGIALLLLTGMWLTLALTSTSSTAVLWFSAYAIIFFGSSCSWLWRWFRWHRRTSLRYYDNVLRALARMDDTEPLDPGSGMHFRSELLGGRIYTKGPYTLWKGP